MYIYIYIYIFWLGTVIIKPNFWSHCFNSPELKAQVRYDNEYIDGLCRCLIPFSKEYISVLIKFKVKHIW